MKKDSKLIAGTLEHECIVDDEYISIYTNNDEYNEEMSIEERLLVLKSQNDNLQEQINTFASILSHFQREHEYSISKEILESKEACMAITSETWNKMLYYYANIRVHVHSVEFIVDMMANHRRTWPRKPTARQAAHALKLLAEYTEYATSMGLDSVTCEAATVQSSQSPQDSNGREKGERASGGRNRWVWKKDMLKFFGM